MINRVRRLRAHHTSELVIFSRGDDLDDELQLKNAAAHAYLRAARPLQQGARPDAAAANRLVLPHLPAGSAPTAEPIHGQSSVPELINDLMCTLPLPRLSRKGRPDADARSLSGSLVDRFSAAG